MEIIGYCIAGLFLAFAVGAAWVNLTQEGDDECEQQNN